MSRTKQVTLPSGRVVTIRRPGIMGLRRIMAARPAWLQEAAQRGETSVPLVDPQRRDEFMGYQFAQVCAASVDPRFTAEDPVPSGCTSLDELDDADFLALYREVQELEGEVAGRTGPLPVTTSS